MDHQSYPVVAPAAAFVDSVSGEVKTTSIRIAEYFGKNHRDVLKAVSRLECSEEFNQRNFAPVEYTDAKGERRPMYSLTRDGFVFLAMGFTGPKAAQVKEAYINAFNQMERELKSREREEVGKLKNQIIAVQARAVKAERGWRVELQKHLRTIRKLVPGLPGAPKAAPQGNDNQLPLIV